ncbi:hypothetical protein OIU77_019337 [Salix suchowensis]|uniref:Uncharacterized protein n=1 Tax=Salix suchowensis TaxID=1278906 RepID=A0ABQ9CFR4_9ROSI|nr:hypothetical protein OIU77_019337 [Salix suchowensis]
MCEVQKRKKCAVEYCRCRIGKQHGKVCFFAFHVNIVSFHTFVWRDLILFMKGGNLIKILDVRVFSTLCHPIELVCSSTFFFFQFCVCPM